MTEESDDKTRSWPSSPTSFEPTDVTSSSPLASPASEGRKCASRSIRPIQSQEAGRDEEPVLLSAPAAYPAQRPNSTSLRIDEIRQSLRSSQDRQNTPARADTPLPAPKPHHRTQLDWVQGFRTPVPDDSHHKLQHKDSFASDITPGRTTSGGSTPAASLCSARTSHTSLTSDASSFDKEADGPRVQQQISVGTTSIQTTSPRAHQHASAATSDPARYRTPPPPRPLRPSSVVILPASAPLRPSHPSSAFTCPQPAPSQPLRPSLGVAQLSSVPDHDYLPVVLAFQAQVLTANIVPITQAQPPALGVVGPNVNHDVHHNQQNILTNINRPIIVNGNITVHNSNQNEKDNLRMKAHRGSFGRTLSKGVKGFVKGAINNYSHVDGNGHYQGMLKEILPAATPVKPSLVRTVSHWSLRATQCTVLIVLIRA